MKKPLPLIVEVIWRDSYANPRWMSVDEAHATMREDFDCVSTGYLYSKDAKHVVLASSIGSEGHVGMLTSIPAPMVKSITTMRAGRRIRYD